MFARYLERRIAGWAPLVQSHDLLLRALRIKRLLGRHRGIRRAVFKRLSLSNETDEQLTFLESCSWPSWLMSAIYGLPKRFITNYSMKADSVLWLIGELECRRPRFILEVGCGISTVAIAAYLSHNYSDTLRPLFVSLESDPEWLDKTRGAIDSLELTKAVMMKHAPLVRAESFGLHGTGIDIGELPLNNRIDFLVVDAPPSVIGRVMVVPQIHEYLADGAEIVLDDAARPGEVEAVETWRRLGLVDFKGYVVSGNGIASMRKRK